MLEVFDEFIAKFEKRVERENASFETLKHWRSTKKKVASFIRYYFDREDVHFSSLPDTFAEDLYDYLTLHVAKPLAEVTARKEVKWVRQMWLLQQKSGNRRRKRLITSRVGDFRYIKNLQTACAGQYKNCCCE